MSVRFFSTIVVLALSTGCVVPRKRNTSGDQESDAFSESYYSGSNAKKAEEGAAPSKQNLPQPKKRIAVFKFWNDTPIKQEELATAALNRTLDGLNELGKDKVVLPEEVQGLLDTKDFVSGDSVKVAQLVREGRRLGVSLIVIGRIARAQFRQKGEDVGILRQAQSVAIAEVEIKVFDVSQGRELLATGKVAQAESTGLFAVEASVQSPEYRAELSSQAIQNAITPLVPQILTTVDKLGWEGRIVKSAGNKYYINAGKLSGLIIGDILKVMTPGEDIYDPATSAFLGRTEGRWKGTLEVMEFVGPDAAVARLHTGGQFFEGDVIRLY